MTDWISRVEEWLRHLAERLASELSWSRLVALGACGLAGQILWSHYGILWHKRLPYHDLGPPIIGHTRKVFQESLENWGQRIMKGKPVLLANYLFTNTVVIRHEIYMKHVHRAELDGKLCPLFPSSIRAIIGENSVISLPGGKGHSKHKRLRGKLLRCLGPQYVLSLAKEMESYIRATLEDLAEETSTKGFGTFEPAAGHLAQKISILPILAGLEEDQQRRFESLLEVTMAGMLAAPVNLGVWLAHGRALRARKEISTMIAQLMASPKLDGQNIVAELMKDSDDGEAFSKEEISDTVVTLLFAGKITTADALPFLLVQLAEHRECIPQLASEPLEVSNIEGDSVALRVVREALRLKPPAGAFRRVNWHSEMDLGEYGVVPKGCPMAIYLSLPMIEMGPWAPDRWRTEDVRSKFLAFGGAQPHECIGKHLALLELQLFVKILCKDYDFKVLDTGTVVKPFSLSYKDGLRVEITRK
ncbi:unnamed protein product [Durusdinium trenchii]|uniref:Cytochrome P450 85A (C6-oxidase) n=2 Tax=Durusdinium trenchii TaxID=1381693 RepID=A0ABP0L140_9DINO